MKFSRQREKRTPPNRDENNDADSRKDKFPARLHVLLASEAPVGVVFRRGPARQVATLLWDRRTDQFQLGQWLLGQIYEHRSDLSPDGKHLLYFASKQWRCDISTWTAISRAPYLKALVMRPMVGTYEGGGLWTGNTSYWLNRRFRSVMHDDPGFQRDDTYEPSMYTNSQSTSVYYPRLLRDGWQLTESHTQPYSEQSESWYKFEKPLRHGWMLKKTAHESSNHPPGRGPYWDTHELVHAASGISHPFPDWEWADVDRERLVWAQSGKLFAGQIIKNGLTDAVELYDFNDMKFERIIAPY